VGLCLVALGGAYGAALASGRLGLPMSRELIFEGRWAASGWDRFPWLDGLGMLLFMFLLPVAWRRFRLRRVPSGGSRPTRRVLMVSAVGVAAVILVYAARRLAAGPSGGPPREGLVILGSYWFLVALGEEATFRGMLQAGCESIAGLRVALPVATVVFVFWHGLPASATQLLVQSAVGAGLGLLYHTSRSLVPPVLCHWLFNLVVTA
jgi:membrane protease YdiL (CAAX protease family)